MPYFKYSAFWPMSLSKSRDGRLNNMIYYYWEVPGGGTESATTTSMFGDKGQTSSSSCKTKYENLPQSLKSCLDYCAFLKDIGKFYLGEGDDFSLEEIGIEKDELVSLMVAEGLIEEKAGEGDAFSLEEIASSFIDELIRLQMLIPQFYFSLYRGSITEIKVSEAYYKLCVVEGNSDDFVARNSHSPIRVFVRLYDANDISPCLKNLPVQSLFLLSIYDQPSQATIDTIQLRSLLVLVIIDLSSNISFNGVGEMDNLRFLRFFRPAKFLPTLGNLQNLHTLDLPYNCDVVPEEVMHMKSLRRLLAFFLPPFRLRKGIGRLANLQTLVGWDARSDVIGELRSLTQMRRLHVYNVVDETIDELLETIMTMKNLISLFMTAQSIKHQKSRIQVLPFLEPFSPPHLLQELKLDGILMELPNWFASLKNLTSLILIGSSLSENPSTILQSLPKLKCLCLKNAYNAKLIGKEFCGAGGFPKLEILKIESHVLVEWTEIVFGAFPSLTSLSCSCKNLRFFPEGLQNISTLQELHIASHGDLIRRLEGDENYKIQHIPSIKISSEIWI